MMMMMMMMMIMSGLKCDNTLFCYHLGLTSETCSHCTNRFLLRDTSAERGYEIACRPSVHLSVSP